MAEGGVDVGVVVHEAGGGRVMVVVVMHPAFAGALLWKKKGQIFDGGFFQKSYKNVVNVVNCG